MLEKKGLVDNVVTDGAHVATQTDENKNNPSSIKTRGDKNSQAHRQRQTKRHQDRIRLRGLLFENTPPSLSEQRRRDTKAERKKTCHTEQETNILSPPPYNTKAVAGHGGG